MALLVFFVVGGGLLTGINTSSLVGIAAASGLVGMFAEHASMKLKELIEALIPIKTDAKKDTIDPVKKQ